MECTAHLELACPKQLFLAAGGLGGLIKDRGV